MSATTGGAVQQDYSAGTTGSLLARSHTVQAMAAHPAVVAAVEAVLGRQLLHPPLAAQLRRAAAAAAAKPSGTQPGAMISPPPVGLPRLGWRVHVDLTIPKDAGQPAQQLHRDGDLSLWDCGHDLDHAVSVIWALDGGAQLLLSTRGNCTPADPFR